MLFIFPYAKLEKTNDFNPSHITAPVTRTYERGVHSVHRSGARRDKKGARESLKSHIALATDVFVLFVFICFCIFNNFLVYLEIVIM
jgi:hypothetical protein